MNRMRSPNQGLMLCLFMALFFHLNSPRVIQAMDKAQFIREYEKASDAYLKRIENVTCKAHKKDALRKSDRQIVFSRADGFEKMDSKIQVTEGSQRYMLEEVYCLSEDTLFQLLKAPGKDQFSLKSKSLSTMEQSIYDQEFGDFLHFSLGGRRGAIYRHIQQNKETLTNVSDPDPKTGYVKIKLEFGKGEVKENIVADLDPANSWAVVHYIRQTEINHMRISKNFDVKYGPKVDGFAMPTLVTLEERNEYLKPKIEDRIQRKATMEFSDWRFEKRPISEFKLTHYQLPDIPLKPESRTNWKLYGGLTAIILLLVSMGLYLRSIARRKGGFTAT